MNCKTLNAFIIIVLTLGLLSVSRPERALAGRLQAPPPPPIPTGEPGRIPDISTNSEVSPAAISPVTNAKQLAVAMGIPLTAIVSATLNGGDLKGAGVGTAHLGHFFPTQGTTFAILSTGYAANAGTPNTSGSLTGYLNSTAPKGVDGHDMTRLILSLKVPAWANCANVDFAFYSEEYPEFVGSQFNDAFTAEKGGTHLTFDPLHHKVVAPWNFAFDTKKNIISVNTVFGMTANTGTTYDGGTALLRAETKVTPGTTTKFVFSIQDLGDNAWDSTVFLDKFVWSHNTTCAGGGKIVYYTLTAQSVGAQDGTVRESTETSGVGGFMDAASTTFNVGDDALKRQYKGILSFNTAPLPNTAVITSATLKIKKQSVVGTPWVTLGTILADIRKGPFGLAALQWTDFQAPATRYAGLTFTNTPLAGAWYSKALSAANRVYINKLGLTQFRLRFATDDDNDSSADYLKFYSGNASATYRPQLIIVYYVP